jgi:uncharacterized protein (DUF2236 family)
MWIPARRAFWLGGIGPIASSVRHLLGISWSALDEAQIQAMGTALRPLTPLMPSSLRIGGPDQLRYRREAIRQGPLGADAA